jgi:1-acyl-sn-glycerol-3-phosphate acyltransferase
VSAPTIDPADQRNDPVLVLRSLLFNLLFYVNLIALMLAALPAMLLPRRVVVEMSKQWGRNSLWLLRTICGVEVEWRGRERIPAGPLLIAAKHQSTWETFALLPLLRDPTYIVKRELMWIPLFGWLSRKAGMIPVDRGAGLKTLKSIREGTRTALADGRQIVVFPEGTRRAPGAEPDYKSGVAHIYAGCDTACLPVALNSGLFWPRRKLLRPPGTIVVEFLEPIPPGLRRDVFLRRLENAIEESTARLVAEGQAQLASNHA